MTVIQLECFLEAVKQGSFSLAAANLYLSQPTMSRHIQALEEELHTSLFIRANNTIRLSSVGQELYPKLEALYYSIINASKEMREIVDQHSGRLRIGVLASLLLDPQLRSALKSFHTEFPRAKIQLCHLSLKDSYHALMDGIVDALFSYDAVMPPSDKVRSFQLYESRMCLAVPTNHPNAHLKEISHAEIESYFGDLDYFLLDSVEFEQPVRYELETLPAYTESGVVKLSGPFADLDSLMLMVDAGLSVTCISESSIIKNNSNVALIPLVDRIQGIRTERKIRIGPYWADKNTNPLLYQFLDLLKRN